jgi:hypothetical protein
MKILLLVWAVRSLIIALALMIAIEGHNVYAYLGAGAALTFLTPPVIR